MTNKHIIRILSWVIIFLLMTPLGAMPQDTGESAPSSANFTKEELDQMLAPIALYPDSLLSQILMASTYPIEVVDADRWVKQNPNLTGNQLDEALKDKDWDVSVKSLCHFPSVLSAMSQNLDETTRLGNAFLNQQQDVMDTIQELRDKARAQDNLNTTPQQKVIFQQGATEIVPTDPAVIYVPMYDPAVVYGPWWYPAYPPYAWYPGVTIGLGISFGVGFFVGAAVGSWCGFDWGHHDVNVDIHRTTVFNNVNIYNVHEGWQRWDHNPQHRMGVAYWNKSTSQRFGQPATRPTEFRNQYRGYGENEFKAQSLHQGQLKKGGSTFGSFGGTKRGNYETSYNTRSLQQEQFKRGGSTSGSYSGMHWGGHQTSYDTRSLQQKQFKQGGSVGGSFSSSKGGGHDSAFSGINNWNSEHTASQRGWSSYNQSFGGGGHGGGGSHSGGGQKNQKGH